MGSFENKQSKSSQVDTSIECEYEFEFEFEFEIELEFDSKHSSCIFRCNILYPIKLHATVLPLEDFISDKDIFQFATVNEATEKVPGNKQLLLIVVALIVDSRCGIDGVTVKSNRAL